MTKNNKEKLYDLLGDLAIEYIDDENIDFDDNERGENDEIIISIDTLKDYLDENM